MTRNHVKFDKFVLQEKKIHNNDNKKKTKPKNYNRCECAPICKQNYANNEFKTAACSVTCYPAPIYHRESSLTITTTDPVVTQMLQ